MSGDTLIWGNPTYGIWGQSKWGDESSIGSYEKIMPLDILPVFLLRALLMKDIEEAEKLRNAAVFVRKDSLKDKGEDFQDQRSLGIPS